MLEFQSDRIEATLARHQVRVRVTGGTVAPRWIQFQVQPALGTRVNKIRGLAEELALSLGVDSCRISRRGGLLSVEIPRPDPRLVRLLPLQKRLSAPTRPVPFGTAVLGLADDGLPLLICLPSPQVAHLLIAGTTGSGKSALAQTVTASLAMSHQPSQFGLVLIDPKRRAFGPLSRLPHLVRPVLSEAEEIERTLFSLVQLMMDRDAEGRLPASAGHRGDPRIVVIVDELADLLMMAPESERALRRLTQRGREAGIHLVACTQKPSAAILGGLLKANFPVRLVGRVTSPEDAKVASGYAATGAEHLRGPGDFVAVAAGQVTRFQAAYASPVELAEIVRGLAGNGHPSNGWRLPEPTAPCEDDDELLRRVERARPAWEAGYLGQGLYEWGTKGRIAAAIFQDGKTSTAGHRHAAVQEVCRMLELECEPDRAEDRNGRPSTEGTEV